MPNIIIDDGPGRNPNRGAPIKKMPIGNFFPRLPRSPNRIYADQPTTESPPAPPPPTPPTPAPVPTETKPSTTSVKQATPDIIVFDEQVDAEYLVQAFFEEFGGTELINISRSDLINGEEVSYSPIINLSSLRQSFNPNNIIAIGAFQENITKYGINLFARGVTRPYFDDNGNLVIEIDDVRQDESIEVELATNGTINVIEL